MIAKKISIKPKNDNFNRLARYVTGAAKEEKCIYKWYNGCYADSVELAIKEIELTQARNLRTEKEKTYHLMLSFHPEDESKLTEKIFKDIESETAKVLGFEEHQRFCGVHNNTKNIHMHIAYSMIHPVKFTRHEPFRDYKKLQEVCRQIEIKYGILPEIQDGKNKKLNEKARTIEAQSGHESLLSYALDKTNFIKEAFEKSKTWHEFQEELKRINLKATPKGNGLVFKDIGGKHAVKASDVDRGLSLKNIEKKFGKYVEIQLSFGSETKKQIDKYQAKPLYHGPKKNILYEQYLVEKNQKKEALEALKKEEVETFFANRSKWTEKRNTLNQFRLLPQHRQQLMEKIKAYEQAEILESRKNFNQKKKKIREEKPYNNWTSYLKFRAQNGDENALEILRTKGIENLKEETSETTTNFYDWKEKELKIEEEANRKRITLAEIENLNLKSRKALSSVIKMEEIIKKYSLKNQTALQNAGFTYTIDSKGTIIYKLSNSSVIRDTGKAIYFPPGDETCQAIVKQYAGYKWRNITFTNNSVTSQFQSENNKIKPLSR
jgi:hypothetical protein